ncbi:MAG: hypothetical protein ACHQFW_08795 [Chitinophagales bacterium]
MFPSLHSFKYLLLQFLFLSLPTTIISAQSPPVNWETTFGGTAGDLAWKFLPLDDNGVLVAGISLSGISGIKTEVSQGWMDYWIVRLDSSGAIVW